jgi:hypothetical protein
MLEYPATLAGHPKHAATHIPHVSVGVTYNLKKFDGLSTHKYQPAPVHEHHSLNRLIGHTDGQQTGQYGIQVIAEKTGSHSSILNQSQIGAQNKVGSPQGANGAQFNGVAIHHPHQNPQLNHCTILSTQTITSSIFSLISSKFDNKSLDESVISSESGIPSLSESRFISSFAFFAKFSSASGLLLNSSI